MAGRKATVVNPKGLHARPASKIAKRALEFEAIVTVLYNDETAEAGSIMDLLMLGAGPGAELRIEATGADAEAAVAALVRLVESGFDEV